ncbi:hypothetical protein D3C87_1628770 [compost metagenome]
MLQALEYGGQVRAGERRRMAELVDVGTGTEGQAVTVHDDGVHGRVGGRLLEGLQQLGTHGLAECIDRRVRQAD